MNLMRDGLGKTKTKREEELEMKIKNKLNKMIEGMMQSTFDSIVVITGFTLVFGMMIVIYQNFQVPETVSEQFLVMEIDEEGYLRGEPVVGSGEGIYYEVAVLEELAGTEIIQPSIIRITWTKEDAENEDWDNIYSVE